MLIHINAAYGLFFSISQDRAPFSQSVACISEVELKCTEFGCVLSFSGVSCATFHGHRASFAQLPT